MNLNDKLKQERTGLTASQYSDLQELFVDRYVDGADVVAKVRVL